MWIPVLPCSRVSLTLPFFIPSLNLSGWGIDGGTSSCSPSGSLVQYNTSVLHRKTSGSRARTPRPTQFSGHRVPSGETQSVLLPGTPRCNRTSLNLQEGTLLCSASPSPAWDAPLQGVTEFPSLSLGFTPPAHSGNLGRPLSPSYSEEFSPLRSLTSWPGACCRPRRHW